MRIKKEFLNKETLCDKYGFERKVLFNDEKYVEYTYKGPWSKLLVQRRDGDIDLVTDMSCDCFPIPPILFDMITDGIVEKR